MELYSLKCRYLPNSKWSEYEIFKEIIFNCPYYLIKIETPKYLGITPKLSLDCSKILWAKQIMEDGNEVLI